MHKEKNYYILCNLVQHHKSWRFLLTLLKKKQKISLSKYRMLQYAEKKNYFFPAMYKNLAPYSQLVNKASSIFRLFQFLFMKQYFVARHEPLNDAFGQVQKILYKNAFLLQHARCIFDRNKQGLKKLFVLLKKYKTLKQIIALYLKKNKYLVTFDLQQQVLTAFQLFTFFLLENKYFFIKHLLIKMQREIRSIFYKFKLPRLFCIDYSEKKLITHILQHKVIFTHFKQEIYIKLLLSLRKYTLTLEKVLYIMKKILIKKKVKIMKMHQNIQIIPYAPTTDKERILKSPNFR